MQSVVGIKEVEKLSGLFGVAKSCGWWAPYKDYVIFQHRHEYVKFDENNLLHCETGPAIRYRDGFSVYSWHGTAFPGEWLENKPSAKELLEIDNIERRRVGFEIIGWDKLLSELNAVSVSKDDNPEIGELFEADLPDSGKERFLKVKCGTGRLFVIPVPPECNSAREANAWTYGKTISDFNPEVRT